MKSTIIAAIMALSIFATAGFAFTDGDVQVFAQGSTYFSEAATIWGYDSSENSGKGDWEMTAYIVETVQNEGTISMVKNTYNPGAWEMTEAKSISADGYTSIQKAVYFWTEDSRTTCGGSAMLYPTETNVFVNYAVGGTSWNDVPGTQHTETIEFHNIADSTVEGTGDQTGEFSHGMFALDVKTFDPINYFEGVGFGQPNPCGTHIPQGPVYPDCYGEFCPVYV